MMTPTPGLWRSPMPQIDHVLGKGGIDQLYTLVGPRWDKGLDWCFAFGYPELKQAIKNQL